MAASEPRVAVVELYNGSSERLPRLDSSSEQMMGEVLDRSNCCRLVSVEELSEALRIHAFSVSQTRGNPSQVAALGALVGADYVVTGEVLNYLQDDSSHEMEAEIVVVAVATGSYVYQKRHIASAFDMSSKKQHRLLLKKILTEASNELFEVFPGFTHTATHRRAGDSSSHGSGPGLKGRVGKFSSSLMRGWKKKLKSLAPEVKPANPSSSERQERRRGNNSRQTHPPTMGGQVAPQLHPQAIAAQGGSQVHRPGAGLPPSVDPLGDGWRLVERGQGISARALFKQALTEALEKGDRRSEASAHDGLCEVWKHQGAPQLRASALAHCRLALETHQELGDPSAEVRTLLRLATIHSAIGQTTASFGLLDRASEILGPDARPEDLAELHEGRAQAQLGLGDLEGASKELRKVVDLSTTSNNPVREERAYGTLARIAVSLGRFEEADGYLQASLDLYEQGGDSGKVVDSIVDRLRQSTSSIPLSSVMPSNYAGWSPESSPRDPGFEDPRYQEALRLAYEDVLADIPVAVDSYLKQQSYLEAQFDYLIKPGLDMVIRPLSEVPPAQICPVFQRSEILADRVQLYRSLGRADLASETLKKAWRAWFESSGKIEAVLVDSFWPTGSQPAKGTSLLNFPSATAESLQEAGVVPPPPLTSAACGRTEPSRRKLWSAEASLATGNLEVSLSGSKEMSTSGEPAVRIEAFGGKGRIYEARGEWSKALDAYQQAIRWAEALREGARVNPMSYSATLQGTYDALIALLAEQGDAQSAFDFSERARSYGLRRLLLGEDLQLKRVSDRDLADLRALEVKIAQLKTTFAPSKGKLDPGGRVEARISELEQQRQSLLDRTESANPEAGSLLGNRVVSLSDIQHFLPPSTTMLVYYSLEEETLVWIVDDQEAHLEILDADRELLRGLTREVREEIEFQESAIQPAGKLYDHLIRPVEERIRHSSLLIVPHGALHHLPFGALWDRSAEKYLLETRSIALGPSVTALRHLDRKRSPFHGEALVLGNPDGSLELAETEAEEIALGFATGAFVKGAAEKRLVLERAASTDILHLAAHGVIDSAKPMESHIALAPAGPDGRLSVGEVYSLDLGEANLVVLSACRSGVGALSPGDDVVSLSRAFLVAGAPSVVTTLWNVDSRSTAHLMKLFYRNLTESETSIAAALQRAQLEILQTEGWESPYFWAPVTLTGSSEKWQGLN